MAHPHSAFSWQNYCLAILMRYRKSHVSRSRVPNRCIRLSGNYQPTRPSGPNRPSRFIRLSGNPPLVLMVWIPEWIPGESIGVKSWLANKGITIKGFLPIILREFEAMCYQYLFFRIESTLFTTKTRFSMLFERILNLVLKDVLLGAKVE